jgi:hypothetical protein
MRSMRRTTWMALLLLSACGKKSDSSDPPRPAAPVAAATSKWVPLGSLGVEVEAPVCAEASANGSNDATVIAGGGAPGCPGFVLEFSSWGSTAAPSLDDEIQMLTGDIPLDVTRKDKTADGWILEYKETESGDSTPKLKVMALFQKIQCRGDSWNDADAAPQRHTCESMRVRK